MKTVEDFIEGLVEIEPQGDQHGYGHYPFQMAVVKEGKKMDICALAMKHVTDYYAVAKKWVLQKPIRLFLSIDFPQMGDMERDFVAVFSIIDGEYRVCAVPYDRESGETFPVVQMEDKAKLREILEQFKRCVSLTDADRIMMN